ncbi:hypothetical protein ACWCP6_13820 [Streptomyces sp. NPDC002004]
MVNAVSVALGEVAGADSLRFDEPGNTVWFTTPGGDVRSVRLLDGRQEMRGRGYCEPIAAIPLRDGLGTAVVERSGRVLVAYRGAADAADASTVVSMSETLLGAHRHPDTGLLVLSGSGLHVVDLNAAQVHTLASPLPGAVAFTVDEHGREAFVLRVDENHVQYVTVVPLDGGSVEDFPQQLSDVVCLVSAPHTDHAVITVSASGNACVHRADGTMGVPTDLGFPVSGLTRWGSLLLAGTGADLQAVEWDLDPGTLPVTLPLSPLFVGGYADVLFDPAAVGLTADEIEFTVDEGRGAGTVSAGVEPLAPDGSTVVTLIAGFQQGEFHLVARRRSSAEILAVRRFRVTACWPDPAVGPPIAVTGERGLRTLNWGGAGSGAGYTAGPHAPGVWRVAVVLVATAEVAFGDPDATAQAWRDHVVGDAVSAKRYFEEVSYFNRDNGIPHPTGMTVKLLGDRVLGPVDLDLGWGDLFTPYNPGDPDGGWTDLDGTKQALANAISRYLLDEPDGFEIGRDADAYVIVVCNASNAPEPSGGTPLPTKFVWGHASRPQTAPVFTRKDPVAGFLGQGPRPVTLMPHVYPHAIDPTSPLSEKKPERVLCHELCHTLGLDDLYESPDYPAEVNARVASRIELMANEKKLPHLSIANRLRLGWVQPSWLRRFDFAQNPNGDTVTLHAIEDLAQTGPPAGEFAGIEVPIDGHRSYFFEYRRMQVGMVGDQKMDDLSSDIFPSFVLGTDVDALTQYPARPPVLLLPEEPDAAAGPILDLVGDRFRDNDVTDPERMFDFQVRLSSLGGSSNTAQVEVTYVGAHRPQLVLNPAPGRGNYRSPDIDLINPLGTFSTNSVVKGVPNRVRVTVHNVGVLDATNVVTHVKWIPFTTTAGDWVQLPDPPPLPVVPAHGTATFDVIWDVPKSLKVNGIEVEHFCFHAEIEQFHDPTHAHDEWVTHDNWAQSNFSTVSVGSGSPSRRIRTVMGVANSCPRTATYLLGVNQTSELFRVYIGNAWLELGPDESRPVEFAYESLAGDPELGGYFAEHAETLMRNPNKLAISAWRRPSSGSECATAVEEFGANLEMHAGQRCWFEDIHREDEVVTARVLTTEDAEVVPVTSGTVYLSAWPTNDPEDLPEVTQGVIDDGYARVLLHRDTLALLARGEPVTGLLAMPGTGRCARTVSEPLTW